jgi:hypothetical protein
MGLCTRLILGIEPLAHVPLVACSDVEDYQMAFLLDNFLWFLLPGIISEITLAHSPWSRNETPVCLED